MTASSEAKDEEITTDDLQAMKAMIGDIKKDPSLLFRLTSLSIDVNSFSADGAVRTATAPNTNTAAIANNNNNNNGVLYVDDDTVVSALTMPSVGDCTTGTNGGYPQHQLPRGTVMMGDGDRIHNMSPTFRMGQGQIQASSTFAQATATAVTRANHDAEIAIRMQSLRAQRSGSNFRRTVQSNGGNNSQEVVSNSNRAQHSTTSSKPLPNNIAPNGNDGRALVRTPPPAFQSSNGEGLVRPKTNNSSPGVVAPTNSKRNQLSSSKPNSGAHGTATVSVDHRESVGSLTPSRRRQRQSQKNSINVNMESENSQHAGTLVLYRENAQGLDRRKEASTPSQAIVPSRGNRNGDESSNTNHHPDAQQRQLSSQSSSFPNNSLAQYRPISTSKKSLNVHNELAQRSLKTNNVHQQHPVHEGERSSSKQPSSNLSTSRRHSSRRSSDRRRGAKSSTDHTAETEATTQSSKALIEAFSSSSPALMSSSVQRHLPVESGHSDSGFNPNEPSHSRRGQSAGRAGNDSGSGKVRSRHGRAVSSSHHPSHRSKQKIRYHSPSYLRMSASSTMLTPIASSPGEGCRSSAESQRADQSQPSPKIKAAELMKQSDSMSLPFSTECRRWSVDEMNGSSIVHMQTLLRNERDHAKLKGTRARAETEPTTAVAESESPDKAVDTEGNDNVSTLVNDLHVNAGPQLPPQSPQLMSPAQSSLGHRLTHLSMSDRNRQHHDQRSERSESGRSVISRLFNPVKRSNSSHEGWGSNGGHSPIANVEHEGCGIVSLKSNGVEFPKIVNQQSLPEEHANAAVDDDNSHHLVNHELHSPGHRYTISHEGVTSDHLATKANDSMRGPQFCDERGRCQVHPHIRLLKPKMFGGWKVLLQYCPDCVLEQLKKNQENLTRIQLQQKKEEDKKKRKSKREKERHQSTHRHRADPIIGKDIGDVEFTPLSEKVKSRYHTKDSEKQREESRQEGLITPSDNVLDKVTPVTSNDQLIDHEQAASSNEVKNCDEAPPSPPPLPAETPPKPSTDSIVPHQGKVSTTKRVNGLPWIDYNGNSGRYTGAVNEQYLPNGQGVMIYDRGSISAGIWYNGVLDTEDSASRAQIAATEVEAPKNEHTPAAAPAKVLPKYTIGDTGRTEDMIIDTKKVTAALIAEVRPGDAAFVCRTDGRWTYAVAKSRTYGDNAAIKFKVNIRGSTKEFPTSQWGGFVRPIREPPRSANDGDSSQQQQQQQQQESASSAAATSLDKSLSTLGDFLDSQSGSNSVAGNFMRQDSDNLTTARMKIPSRSRSRSKSRQRSLNTSFPNLLSSDMSVSEENVDGQVNDVWETASGSGYRLRGIDP
ncbi:hypothetical protein ACHAWU_007199 [Discostella pseudostelligera]|uniref:Uncharacterized protein n=1 Tax=Discostella pseudostelligera TaxID=259834 RepID=A0ABD3M084_9STRA